MATWYSAAGGPAQARLKAAWAGAPIENEELCGFLVDTARLQVLAYAPEATPIIFEPVRLTWPTGWTLDLSRIGDVVTGVLTSVQDSTSGVALPIPAEFQAVGMVRLAEFNSGDAPTCLLTINDVPATGDIGATYSGSMPAGETITGRWLADPAEGTGVPFNLVFAQLQQMKNLWAAGRADENGDIGGEGFSFVPRPLDKTIRSIIRPTNAEVSGGF